MGWLNDLTVRIEQAVYNFDFSRFYAKFIDDIADTQHEDGTITCVAPYRFGRGRPTRYRPATCCSRGNRTNITATGTSSATIMTA